MKEKIEELKVAKEHIEIMISMLEGEFPKRFLICGGTIKGELNYYGDKGSNLQRLIDSIIKEYGDELIPTCD